MKSMPSSVPPVLVYIPLLQIPFLGCRSNCLHRNMLTFLRFDSFVIYPPPFSSILMTFSVIFTLFTIVTSHDKLV